MELNISILIILIPVGFFFWFLKRKCVGNNPMKGGTCC